MSAAVGRVMAAAAQMVKTAARRVYDAWWSPVEAAPVVAPALIYPSPAMQRGETVDEWVQWDEWALPASTPTQHLASRVSGIPDGATQARCEKAWRGVSNGHWDPVDAWRGYGSPITYVPRISAQARRHRRYRSSHPLPSSDLIWCEGQGGGRSVRIVTCVDGWVCIVNAHYESCMHGGSLPVGISGAVLRPAGELDSGRPYLERELVPGVELLRAVCYSLARVDAWCMSVQAGYDVRGDGSGKLTAAQEALLLEVYEALDAPLDERYRRLHRWLPRKPDDMHAGPCGPYGPWGPRPE